VSAARRGPRGWPLVGSLIAWRRHPAEYLLHIRETFGDLVPYRLGPVKALLISRPETIKEILVTRQHEFVKGVSLEWAKEFLGNGLLTAEAPFHTRQRRLAQPAFHRSRLNDYAAITVRRAERLAARLEGVAASGRPIDIAREFMALTLGIAGETLFSAEVEDAASDVGAALKTLMNEFLSFASPLAIVRRRFPLLRSRATEEAKRRIDATIFRIIESRRRGASGKHDLLAMLMEARDEDDGSAMTDEQLRDECVTIFLAGHETTSNALSWAIACLAQSPGPAESAAAETLQVAPGRAVTFADLKSLPTVEGIMAEAMRLYPPAFAIARRGRSRLTLDTAPEAGFIEPTTNLVMSPYVTQRDPATFENPLSFRPERWTAEFKAGLPAFAYFPFGGGARKCIGESFAGMESVLILATLLRRFRFSLADGGGGARIESEALITLRPRHGVRVVVERRNPRAA
jgi:cytochrome P450